MDLLQLGLYIARDVGVKCILRGRGCRVLPALFVGCLQAAALALTLGYRGRVPSYLAPTVFSASFCSRSISGSSVRSRSISMSMSSSSACLTDEGSVAIVRPVPGSKVYTFSGWRGCDPEVEERRAVIMRRGFDCDMCFVLLVFRRRDSMSGSRSNEVSSGGAKRRWLRGPSRLYANTSTSQFLLDTLVHHASMRLNHPTRPFGIWSRIEQPRPNYLQFKFIAEGSRLHGSELLADWF
jgi:hypothetical protein